jgi:hypothetical protein
LQEIQLPVDGKIKTDGHFLGRPIPSFEFAEIGHWPVVVVRTHRNPDALEHAESMSHEGECRLIFVQLASQAEQWSAIADHLRVAIFFGSDSLKGRDLSGRSNSWQFIQRHVPPGNTRNECARF